MAANPVVTVKQVAGDLLRIQVRDHVVYSDQPVEDGGEDVAPTPTELFLAGLAGCVTYYAERFLRRHELPSDGLEVSCEWSWAEHPHRVGRIDLTVAAPTLPAEREDAFRRVVEHCTVHNTLAQPPELTLRVVAPVAARVGAG